MVSLRSTMTSCTFEPQPTRDLARGMDLLGDFTSEGRTECVLVDRERNLSLALRHTTLTRNGDAFEAAASFRDALESLHTQLTS